MPSIEQYRQDVDSYKDTVSAILAFVHEMIWDEARRQARLDTIHEHGSPQSWNSGADPVTPDLAFVCPQEFAVIGEAKMSLGGHGDRGRLRDQLAKYDRVMQAWLSPEPPRAPLGGVVLLTHQSRKVDAEEYLVGELEANRYQPRCPIAIVAYNRNDQSSVHYALERSWGGLVPPSKDQKLRRVVNVKLEHLLMAYGGVKFYDADPPMPYLLQVIWDGVLPPRIPENSYTASRQRATRGRRQMVQLNVDLDEVCEALRNGFSLRLLNQNLPECPRKALVRQAMDKLTAWKLAERRRGDSYSINYRKLNRGAFEYFLRKCAASQSPPPAPQQLRLF